MMVLPEAGDPSRLPAAPFPRFLRRAILAFLGIDSCNSEASGLLGHYLKVCRFQDQLGSERFHRDLYKVSAKQCTEEPGESQRNYEKY